MNGVPLAIRAAGMITAVGLDWRSSAAAIRAGLNSFEETRFVAKGGDWIIACDVPLDPPFEGVARLAKLAARAVGGCLAEAPEVAAKDVALLLCVAEEGREGRPPDLGSPLFFEVERELGLSFHASSRVIADGRVGSAIALHQARRLVAQGVAAHVIVAGVDSFLEAATLAAFDDVDRLLTPENSNGFIPGEAAAAVLLTPPRATSGPALVLRGLGFAREPAPILSDAPLRADGLVAAFGAALAEAGLNLHDVHCRCCDINGEQYGFKEAELAFTRLLRAHKGVIDLWHPADCVGEVGAATLPVVLGLILAATSQGWDPGPRALCHVGNDDGRRAALVFEYGPVPRAAAA